MFSYVAKSLLSKTLRTFLRKYLENIELESIDYGTSDSGKAQNAGGSSGWGVKLSNVKLREGMELVKLPGKRKRVVTRKKKVKRNKSNEGSEDCDKTPRTTNSKRVITVERGEESFVLQPKPSATGAESRNGTGADSAEDLGTSDDGIDKEGIILQPVITLPLNDHDQGRDRLISSSSADIESGYFSSSPPTPNQSSHGICGVPSTLNCLNRNSVDYAIPHEKDLGESSTQATGNGSSLNARSQDDFADDDSYIEVEEEVTVEDDLALVVGAGGSIGTLNIRLVDKELHVTVEDAHFIVEALPGESNTNKSENDESTKLPQKQEPTLKRSPSASRSSSQTDLPGMVDGEEGKAKIGEKIKGKSMIAKYLSMIPHLFLRDCRVSLLLPEEFGTDSSDEDSCADECTVFELGIDFLSVTSGDDLLDVLRFDTGCQSSESIPKPKTRSGSEALSSKSEAKRRNNLMPNNQFQRKRIRTGRGPEGGIWLKIHPPQGKVRLPKRINQKGPKWARIHFLESSEAFTFRCSGIDLHARMLVDKKIDEEDDIGAVLSNEYEDYTMDSMLFGVDYVDPISLTRAQIRENIKREQIKTLDDASDAESDTDANGIQSIPFPSNIHWMAKRAHREGCQNRHLPLQDCFYCWGECINQKSKSSSAMSNLMPLPGFVFSLSISDPLELNVDRSSLEALRYMKLLMTSDKSSKRDDDNSNQRANIDSIESEKSHVKGRPRNDQSSADFDNQSFPRYMQPDAIYLSGVYLSKVVVRVEAIRSSIDCGPKFRFWQFVGQSIYLEESQVDADELIARDVTLHVGGIECKDFSGVTGKNLLVAGEGLDTVPPIRPEVYLPNTSTRVLGVPSDKKSSKIYAVHARLLRSDAPMEAGDESQESNKVSYANLQLGMIDIDVENILLRDVSKATHEAKSIFVNGEKKKKQNGDSSKPGQRKSSKWLLHLSTNGGSLSYKPRIKVKLPKSSFQLRKGDEGLSFDTVMQRLGVEYGAYRFKQPTEPSIAPLCTLPESLRMHILVYLDDLTPLERVFNIKKKKKNASSFLRIHAINKKLAKLALISQTESSSKNSTQKDTIRRDNAMNRLQSLDTESLEALLALHDSHRRNKVSGHHTIMSES